MSDRRRQAIRRWMQEILQDRYAKHDPIVERITTALVTDRDTEEFGKMVADLFEVGYLKCLNDYRSKLTEMGLNVTVVADRH